jgi:hypothetical protein
MAITLSESQFKQLKSLIVQLQSLTSEDTDIGELLIV